MVDVHSSLVERRSVNATNIGPSNNRGIYYGSQISIGNNMILTWGRWWAGDVEQNFFRYGASVLRVDPVTYALTRVSHVTFFDSTYAVDTPGNWVDTSGKRVAFFWPRIRSSNPRPQTGWRGAFHWDDNGNIFIDGVGEFNITGAAGDDFIENFYPILEDDFRTCTILWTTESTHLFSNSGMYQTATINLENGAHTNFGPLTMLKDVIDGGGWAQVDWEIRDFAVNELYAMLQFNRGSDVRQFKATISNGNVTWVDSNVIGFGQEAPFRRQTASIIDGDKWTVAETPLQSGIFRWGAWKRSGNSNLTQSPVNSASSAVPEYQPWINALPAWIGRFANGNYEVEGKQLDGNFFDHPYMILEVTSDLDTPIKAYPVRSNKSPQESGRTRIDDSGDYRISFAGLFSGGVFNMIYIWGLPDSTIENGCECTAKSERIRVTHTKGSSLKPNGLAMIEPFYHLFTTEVAPGAEGESWEIEVPEDSIMVFRLLHNGYDPGESVFNSSNGQQVRCSHKGHCCVFSWEDINRDDPREIYAWDGDFDDAITKVCPVTEGTPWLVGGVGMSLQEEWQT